MIGRLNAVPFIETAIPCTSRPGGPAAGPGGPRHPLPSRAEAPCGPPRRTRRQQRHGGSLGGMAGPERVTVKGAKVRHETQVKLGLRAAGLHGTDLPKRSPANSRIPDQPDRTRSGGYVGGSSMDGIESFRESVEHAVIGQIAQNLFIQSTRCRVSPRELLEASF